jgi:hypothetical protein
MHGSAPTKIEETIVGLPPLLVLSVFSRSDSPDLVAVTFHLQAIKDGVAQSDIVSGLSNTYRARHHITLFEHQA